ncbi:O-antigen translocase [Pedobacter jamesrossensis]|uniref:O-antigen translocase n=1 Tax=Pedobacter jamesrossensis TaxID=1908238 RepID=A0ABV8NIR8_9SPHI
MKLIKTTFFSALITFIRIASGFVAGKVVATLTGASGVAIIGAFVNFITIVLTFANGAINTGVIKYTAENNQTESKLKSLFSTALKISIYCSGFTGIILLSCSSILSDWIFKTEAYSGPIGLLGLTIVFYSLNTLLISILNGKGEIKIYTIVNGLGSVVGLILTIVLVWFYKIKGALYAMVLAQSIVFFVTVFLISKSSWFSYDYFRQKFDRSIAVKLSHYSLMAIISAIVVPLSQIILRNIIIDKIGINQAGYWQGMMRISDGYLMLITTALSTYYLPKLSSLNSNIEIRKEIFKGYSILIPTVFIGCCIIYFLRFIIIRILYTPDFLIMEKLFIWQMAGDFLKICAWILSYLMLAKAMTKIFIITEIIFSLSYVFLGYFFIGQYNLVGISMAFALNYLIYLLVMALIFKKLLFKTALGANESQ